MADKDIWWSGGSTRARAHLKTVRSEIKTVQAPIASLVSTFGALGDAAWEAGMKFEDAAKALQALGEENAGALQEPKRCVFCDADTDRRVKHSWNSYYMKNIPIWTRVCDGCAQEPLCESDPGGVHVPLAATSRHFEVRFTVVVDLENLDRCGHCRDCGLPLTLRKEGWRYWTPAERARLMGAE